MGSGGGQVVSVLAFYNFSVKLLFNSKQREARVGIIKYLTK